MTDDVESLDELAIRLYPFAARKLREYRIPSYWTEASDMVHSGVEAILAAPGHVGDPEAYARRAIANRIKKEAAEYRRFPRSVPLADSEDDGDGDPRDQRTAREEEWCSKPELHATRLEQKRYTVAALEELSVPQKVAIVAIDGYGMSRPETAKLLDKPLGTVNSHCYRGRRNFRAAAERIGLLALYTMATIFVGSCLLYVFREFFAIVAITGAAMAAVIPPPDTTPRFPDNKDRSGAESGEDHPGPGLVVFRSIREWIRQFSSVAIRVGIRSVLGCALFTGTVTIWQLGILRQSFSPAHDLVVALIAIGVTLLVMHPPCGKENKRKPRNR